MINFASNPVYSTPMLPDGKIFVATDPGGGPCITVMVGTGPLPYVEATIRRITREVFPRSFLEQIKMWEPTGAEIMAESKARQ